jgi:hypothetical protein
MIAGLMIAGCTAQTAGTEPGRRNMQDANLVPTGQTTDCVQLTSIRETRVLDDRTIDFVMRNSDIYRNQLPYSCPSLGFEKRFSYRTSLSRLCSVDTITVLMEAGGLQPGASCGLGQFQKMAKTR